MYENVKKHIEEILEISKKCPENLQVRCFELLLTEALREQGAAQIVPRNDTVSALTNQFAKPFPIDVRAFMQQYTVSEENIRKLFLLDNDSDEIKDAFSIKTVKKARAQIQLAVLIALKHALKGQGFKFSIDEVRDACKEHRCLDAANFSKILKDNGALFKSLEDKENVELNPEGKRELSETLLEL